ncbi:MAG: hypothetical protein KIT84_00240 [Labilithrix sp.]|nr:hypothetical protein [Labilithrix sp.]MCW5809411.1 hypothetical protein [Labilithrix sp.]
MSDNVLVVDARAAPGSPTDSGGTAVAPIALPVLAAGLLAKLVAPAAGLAALGAGAALFVLRWKPNRGRFVLRVTDGVLEVARERGRDAPLRLPIADVLAVVVHRTKTPAAGGPAERVQIAFDRAAPAEPIVLPESTLTPLESEEWVGKIRVFLRKHGWLPKAERQ